MSQINDLLKSLIDENGDSVMTDARRLKAYLLDHPEIPPRERNALSLSVEAGIPNDLKMRSGGPVSGVANRLTRRLADEFGLDATLARWTVATWAETLGIDTSLPPRPALQPESATWEGMESPGAAANPQPIAPPRPAPSSETSSVKPSPLEPSSPLDNEDLKRISFVNSLAYLKDTRRLENWILFLLIPHAFFSFFIDLFLYDSSFNTYDMPTWLAIIFTITCVFYILGDVAFLRWLARANWNARLLGAKSEPIKSNALIIWIVGPFIFGIFLVRIVAETWRRSDPKLAGSFDESWKRSKISPMISGWFLFGFASFLIPKLMNTKIPILIVFLSSTRLVSNCCVIFFILDINARLEELHQNTKRIFNL